MSAPQTDTPTFVRAEYLESGSFVSIEEACELAGIKIGERVAILKITDFESLERELSEAKKERDALRGIAERMGKMLKHVLHGFLVGVSTRGEMEKLLSELDALNGEK